MPSSPKKLVFFIFLLGRFAVFGKVRTSAIEAAILWLTYHIDFHGIGILERLSLISCILPDAPLVVPHGEAFHGISHFLDLLEVICNNCFSLFIKEQSFHEIIWDVLFKEEHSHGITSLSFHIRWSISWGNLLFSHGVLVWGSTTSPLPCLFQFQVGINPWVASPCLEGQARNNCYLWYIYGFDS